MIIRLKRQYLISNVEHSLFLLQVVCSECNYISATKAEALFQRYASCAFVTTHKSLCVVILVVT